MKKISIFIEYGWIVTSTFTDRVNRRFYIYLKLHYSIGESYD